jgi:uncharacterized repeat protein (TIGR03837 family)
MDTPAALLRWDLFCRVVDNLGDAAVMWRLARQLAVEHRRRVRLHVDQPAVLRRLVPRAAPGRRVDGVEVIALPDLAELGDPGEPMAAGSQVVVTGFHAALPEPWRRRMAVDRPVWINLEYLSAEDWIERFHRLPSTHADGAVEHYFYPGFTPASGGLLREADLFERRDRFLADPALAQQFLAGLGVRRREGETLASLLCYPDAPLAALARQLAGSATRLHLLVPDGVDIGPDSFAALAEAGGGRLRLERIPFVPQRDYDPLLWSCDFNFVRGEDSLVRGLWSDRPFVWQIYRQDDDAHVPKLEAFLRLLPPGPLTDAMRWWNRLPGSPDNALLRLAREAPADAAALPEPLVQRLANPDLANRLLAFAGDLAVSRASAGISGSPL